MRKIYLTLALMMGFGWAMAQNQVSSGKIESDQFSQSEMTVMNQSVQKFRSTRDASKTIMSRWYGYGFELDNQLGNIGTAGLNNLWPDSTILVNYSTGYSGTWVHSLGEVINPKSSIFTATTGGLNINEVMPYTIDSIGFYCFYYRNANYANAVDTLMVQILVNGDGNYYWHQGTSSWVMTNYGTDTLWFKGIKHDALKNYSTNPNYVTYKFPLTASMENDTLANGVNYFKFPVSEQIGSGETFVATFQFIPGFSWTPNVDTITNVNRLRFISYEENGDAGGSGTYPSYIKRDWNCSYILPSDWMYDATSTLYAPSYAYTAPFGYEHHWVEFLLTADMNGISSSVDNNLSVGQNQPNPFSGTTTIAYSLNERADVSVAVYNVAGAKVMEVSEGAKTAGNHTMILDASSLKSGVYYYTFTAGGNKVTKKMIVY